MPVRAGERDGQRGPACVDDPVVLRARSGAVDRARPGFGPPRRACWCEPSITARDQSSFPARCSSVSGTWCSRSHTPASCQSRNRRQQVIPEPKPSSWGNHSHWMPVCCTNKMPCRHLRSSSGSRPGLRRRRVRTGSSGSILTHRSPVTSHGGPCPFPTSCPTSQRAMGHGRKRPSVDLRLMVVSVVVVGQCANEPGSTIRTLEVNHLSWRGD